MALNIQQLWGGFVKLQLRTNGQVIDRFLPLSLYLFLLGRSQKKSSNIKVFLNGIIVDDFTGASLLAFLKRVTIRIFTYSIFGQ